MPILTTNQPTDQVGTFVNQNSINFDRCYVRCQWNIFRRSVFLASGFLSHILHVNDKEILFSIGLDWTIFNNFIIIMSVILTIILIQNIWLLLFTFHVKYYILDKCISLFHWCYNPCRSIGKILWECNFSIHIWQQKSHKLSFVLEDMKSLEILLQLDAFLMRN